MLTYILKVAPKKLGEVAVHPLCMEDVLHGVSCVSEINVVGGEGLNMVELTNSNLTFG